jgi:protein Tex
LIDYTRTLATNIGVRSEQVGAAINLLDEGNTIPFIARYRKEMTGVLDEEQLRLISEGLDKLRALDERRATILTSIEEQGKLTPELNQQIQQAGNLTALEDLYLPYKPKRRTRASIAREKGLQGLADLILRQEITRTTAEAIARSYLTETVPTVEDALQGARDIVAETISDHPQVRQAARAKAIQWGMLKTERIPDAQDERQVYEGYYQFEGQVNRLRPHQVLAFNRGETEKVLRVHVEMMERDWRGAIAAGFRQDKRSPFFDQLQLAIDDSAERLLLPAIERDVRRIQTEQAETHAIQVFAANLRALLSQPPLAGITVLGLDPGFRTGCKVAIVDPTGKVLDTGTIYPHEPQKKWAESLDHLGKWVEKYHVQLISIGNGTASRESELLSAELIHQVGGKLKYLITNEAGASVYSASPLARAELPGMDVSLRGAVSIARRVQDPLAELVKIDPKSIGIGLYQHDVNQAELGRTLSGVVESVVNQVGVDANTASPALLAHVSGIGPKLAERVVAHRDENGPFASRRQLAAVKGLGPKAFEQAAGFLRIRGGDQPLDASAIHPESYAVAEKVLKLAGIKISQPLAARAQALEELKQKQPVEKLAVILNCGVPTLMDILEQLARPGRDPREDLPAPVLRSDVRSMSDLTTGMRMKGTVRNVVDFGAFVDIGVHQDGLLHRSQLSPGTTLELGQIIDVEILKVEPDRGRISLKLAGNIS